MIKLLLRIRLWLISNTGKTIADFKAKVVFEAIRGKLMINEISKQSRI